MTRIPVPFFSGVPPVVVTPVTAITLNPANPGDLGLAPANWTTRVTATGGLTQVKWTVGIPGAKTIQFPRASNLVAVPNYNHGDIINFTGYGTNFAFSKDASAANRFIVSGSLGSSTFTIGTETQVSDIRYTVEGAGGTGAFAYTIVNLSAGIADIQVTFARPGDMLIVKSVDETVGINTSGVIFSTVVTKSITITPHDPGTFTTSPASWTTRINAVGLSQVKWAVVDANWTGSGATIPTQPATTTGLVRGRPVIQGNSIRSDIGTLLRGVTFALDGPGKKSTDYSNTRSNWQKFRDLKFNLVRMPFSLSIVNMTLDQQLPYMDSMVAHASATGMYVMFMYDNYYGVKAFDEAFSCWPTICARYKNNTNVLFEMGNEWVWGANEWSSSDLNSVGDLYTQMHNNAPNSLIGCLMLTSMDSASDTINAMNAVKARAGASNFGNAFIATHSYSGGGYSASTFNTIKASYPCMMTETTYTGNFVDDPLTKIPDIEATGTAWIVLNPRFGDIDYTGTDRPPLYGDDEHSLTQRIIPGWTADGFTWAQDSLSGVVIPPTDSTVYNVVNLVNNTTQVTASFTKTGDTLVVRSTDDTIQDRSNAVTINIPSNVKTLSMNPLNPGDLGTAPKVWQTTVTATGMTSFEWIIRNADNSNVTNWAVANLTNGQVVLSPTFTAAGQVLIISTPDNTVRQTSGAVSFGGGVIIPPTNTSTFNLLLRGQSNAIFFSDYGGFGGLKSNLQTALNTTIGLWGDIGQTMVGGSAFMDWPSNGQQTTFMNYIRALSAQEKAKPFVTLWMHNENDQMNTSLTTAQWVAAVKADAVLFRQALGQTAATTPYLFIPIRYPYGDRTNIVNGMTQLAADSSFNAVLTQVATESDILMDGGPEPGNNSSHISSGDAIRLASKLVNPVISAKNKTTVVIPPSGGTDYDFANNFVKDLTMGINLERGTAVGEPLSYFQRLKSDSHATHLRWFMPSRPDWTILGSSDVRNFCNTMQIAIGAGFKVLFAPLDVVAHDFLTTQQCRDYINMCWGIVQSYNFDPTKFTMNTWNELGEYTEDNTPFNATRSFYKDLARQYFPNHIILTGSAEWSAYQAMTNPSLQVFTDKRVIYEWHSYPWDAEDVNAMKAIGDQIAAWKGPKGIVTLNGELANAGETGGLAPESVARVVASASRGCWRERPTMWTITGGSYFRMNDNNSNNLADYQGAALRDADAYIRAQPGWGT